jgi:hypothetical protein
MGVGAIVMMLLGSACGTGLAFWEQKGAKFSQAFKGVSATMSTYDQSGSLIDRVHGNSFRISRDDRFDSTDAEGNSNKDSSVLLISLGNSHISHVGSSLILAQDGVIDVTAEFGSTKVAFSNTKSGVPFVNDLFERFRNNWRGKSKTLLIRSQDGLPIGVFAGDAVEVFATGVPKSTWFQVDGKMLFVYRCDYTVYDNDLL